MKTHINICIDVEVYKALKLSKENVSGLVNKILRKYLDLDTKEEVEHGQD